MIKMNLEASLGSSLYIGEKEWERAEVTFHFLAYFHFLKPNLAVH